MVMRGMLRNLGAKGAGFARASGAGGLAAIDDNQRLAMLDAFEQEDIGWFWATDGDNRLIYLSPSAAGRFAAGRPVLGEPLGTLIEAVPSEGDGSKESDGQRNVGTTVAPALALRRLSEIVIAW